MRIPPASLICLLISLPTVAQVASPIQPHAFLRSLGGPSVATQVVATDLTGDLIPDAATLWLDGRVVVHAAPEVMSASAVAPVQNATAIAAAGAIPGHAGYLLVVQNGNLMMVNYSVAAGLSKSAIVQPVTWGSIAKVEVRRLTATTALVLVTETNGLTVRVGSLNGLQVTELGTITATGLVLQAAFHELQFNGSIDVVLGTGAGLYGYSVSGAALASYAASAGFTGGLFAPLPRSTNYDRLAWLLRNGSSWSLRVLGRTGQVGSDLPLNFGGVVPANFSLLGFAAGDIEGDGDADLVIHQLSPGSSGLRQIMLRNAEGAQPFSLSAGQWFDFGVAGVDASSRAPVCVADMNNTGTADAIFVTADTPQIVLVTGIGEELPLPAAPPAYPDYLTGAQFLTVGTDVAINLQINVDQVPAQYRGGSWHCEVVAWHQSVASPNASNPSGYGASYVDNNGFLAPRVPMPTSGTLLVPVVMPLVSYPRVANHHYYLQLRFVQLNNGTVGAVSPTRLVGYLAWPYLQDNPTNLNYIRYISTPQGTTQHEIRILDGGGSGGAPKNVGNVKKPIQLNPPWASIPTVG